MTYAKNKRRSPILTAALALVLAGAGLACCPAASIADESDSFISEWFELSLTPGFSDHTIGRQKYTDRSFIFYLDGMEPDECRIEGEGLEMYGYLDYTCDGPVFITPDYVGVWRLRTWVYEYLGWGAYSRVSAFRTSLGGIVWGMWCPDSPDWGYYYPALNPSPYEE